MTKEEKIKEVMDLVRSAISNARAYQIDIVSKETCDNAFDALESKIRELIEGSYVGVQD